MLSLVNSSDPSCSSSKVSGLKADERDSDHFPLQGTDLVARLAEAQSSNFSIRDYVFALRDKKIGKSWPFSSPLLQLCLKHGIRDLLPPFESPNSVRSRCFISSLSKAEKVTVSSSNLGETSLIVLDGEPNSTQTDHLCLPCSHQNDLLTCSDKFKEDKYGHNLVCEIGSIVTNNCEEIIQGEEESSTSTASDIMASKVCPVCKAFSSTSNTTLNAHMDQCLSMESDAALAAEKMQKLKVKPSKKRLMEDIYATAPRCTLEDLDRRNGSTWATYLTAAGSAPVPAPAPSAETDMEPKKPKLSRLGPRDDKNEGAVYVDSNGIKLRILSKFNESPQVLLREEIRPMRSIKRGQDGKVILMKDKKHLTSGCSKKMKLKMRNKKLGSLKMFKKEIQKEHKVSHHEESHLEDERSPVQLSVEADQSLSCGSATLIKSWPSSKRSDLSKKSSKKEFHKILEQPKQVEMLETRKLAASDTPSASKSHFGKLSQFLESKPMDFSSNTDQNKENQTEGTSANVLLKMSRSSGSLVSSPTSTSEEFYLGRNPKSHTYPKTRKRSADLNYIVPLKTKRVSTLSGSNSSAVKFRKHRSLLSWSDQRIREFSSDRNPKQHRSVEAILSEQDTQTQISEMQVDQNVNINSFETADSSSITPNPLDTQDQNLQLGANATTNSTMPIREIEMPVAETLLDNQDKALPDKSQTKATSAEENSSVSLTSHGDLRINIPKENSTIALDLKPPTQETNKIISNCREPSTSPASSVSTISLASPSDYHSNASALSTSRANSSFPFALMAPNKGTQGIDIERNQQLEPDFTVKKFLQQPSDYHPCCCSWQNIMPPTKQKPLPNLHIRPSLMRTDATTTPSLESPTESILTRACSDVGSTSPSSGTPTQSSSNSILRLMGKDLMVVHHEDSAKLPKLNNSNVQALNSQLGFAAYAVSNQSNFSFPVHNLSPSMNNSEGLNCLPPSYQRNKEVIVIEDSDDVFAPRDVSSHVPVSYSMFQNPFSYFPTQSHILAMDNGIRIPNVNNQGSSVPVPHFPRPLLFQSPSATHLNSQFYCQQSLR